LWVVLATDLWKTKPSLHNELGSSKGWNRTGGDEVMTVPAQLT
jgi:hypothetical protein